MLDQPAGTLNGIPLRGGNRERHGSVNPCLTTKNGSCVQIRGIQETLEDGSTKRITGPGKVSKAMGIDKDDVRVVEVVNAPEKMLRIVKPQA